MDRWLKDRRGKKLSNDELEHYPRIASALEQTITLIERVDSTFEANGLIPQ